MDCSWVWKEDLLWGGVGVGLCGAVPFSPRSRASTESQQTTEIKCKVCAIDNVEGHVNVET